MAQLNYFIKTLKGEWGWGGTIIGFIGIIGALRDVRSRRWGVLTLTSWILAGPGFFLLSNLPLDEPTTAAILQPYLLLVGVLWAPFVMWGLTSLPARVPYRAGMMTVLSLALIGTRQWSWTSDRNDFYVYDYARNLLRSLPAGAVLYDPDDPTLFSIQVLQTIENRRLDVVPIPDALGL